VGAGGVTVAQLQTLYAALGAAIAEKTPREVEWYVLMAAQGVIARRLLAAQWPEAVK